MNLSEHAELRAEQARKQQQQALNTAEELKPLRSGPEDT